MARTKRHTTAQAVTYKPLSVAQQNAIDLLLLGKSDREVAEVVGVARETVWHWRHEHPVFLAELNRRRRAFWADAQERLRALVGRAVEILAEAVAGGDLKAAVEVLKIVKLHGAVPAPSGAEDPELVLWQQAEQWAALTIQREGPSVDPLDALLDEGAARKASLAQRHMAALRQQWTTMTDA
jgi:hypothetical protein